MGINTERQDVEDDTPGAGDWLGKCYWGSVDNPPPHPSEVTDEDPDDTLLAVTSPDVVAMLGFDPLELENDEIPDQAHP